MPNMEELINEKNGTIKIPYTDRSFSFEAIEQIYKKIKPLLKKRKRAKIKEGASR